MAQAEGLESLHHAESPKLQAEIDMTQDSMAKTSTSIKKRKQQLRRVKTFLWKLSERTTCWPTIKRGHLGFHIKGVGTSPPDKDIIHLRSEDLRNLQKALHSGKQGRFVLTMEYRNSPGGLLETVLKLRMADMSADPAEFEPPITYIYPGEVMPNNMSYIGCRRMPWLGVLHLIHPISVKTDSDNTTELQNDPPDFIGTITTDTPLQPGCPRIASIELNMQELVALRRLFTRATEEHPEIRGEMLVSF